jgi:ABC-type transporter Mla subunit MlaD
MSNEEVVRQLQQIVDTLKRVIEASGELAERVEALERRSGDEVGMLTSLAENLQVLATQLQSRDEAERELFQDLAERVARLEGRNPQIKQDVN